MRHPLKAAAVPAFFVVRLAFRIWMKYAPATDVDGIRVTNLGRAEDQEQLIGKMREALALLQRVDERRHRQVRGYIANIVLVPTGGSGEYWYGTNTCALDVQYVLKSELPMVAMTVIHESVHARIERYGVRIRGSNIARIEMLCSRAEIEFASRLDDGNRYIERVQTSLKTQWWSDTAKFQRNERRLSALRLPAWLLRAHQLFRPR